MEQPLLRNCLDAAGVVECSRISGQLTTPFAVFAQVVLRRIFEVLPCVPSIPPFGRGGEGSAISPTNGSVSNTLTAAAVNSLARLNGFLESNRDLVRLYQVPPPHLWDSPPPIFFLCAYFSPVFLLSVLPFSLIPSPDPVYYYLFLVPALLSFLLLLPSLSLPLLPHTALYVLPLRRLVLHPSLLLPTSYFSVPRVAFLRICSPRTSAPLSAKEERKKGGPTMQLSV